MSDLLDKLTTQVRQYKADLKRKREQGERTGRQKEQTEEAIEWVTGVIGAMQAVTHERIATVVTRCLAFVFGPDAYAFAIRFEDKGKVRFELTRGGESFDPDDQVGGGVLDVAAFALRLAVVTCLHAAKILVLDEPFRFVSREYRPAVARLLDVVAAEFGVQIIMVTHAEEMVCGRVIQL